MDQAARRTEEAIVLLARAARLAPERSDVQKVLALATGDLGALDDSAAAWNRYLKLQPNDDVARRELGFTAFRMRGSKRLWRRSGGRAAPSGRCGRTLRTGGRREPGQSSRSAAGVRPGALALKPGFAAATGLRSRINQTGKPEAALADLEAAVALRPDDALSLDRLGQTYSALDRPADAVRVLRQAATLAPDDSKTLFHLARALADAGRPEESKAAMDRFRQLGPSVNKGVPGGLVDYLSLTPDQRHADYRRRVERVVHQHPEDAAAQEKYLQLLLEDGEPESALEVARKIAALTPPAAVLADAGRALLAAEQYPMARDLLEKAAAAAPSAALQMDLALAAFHASGPADGTRLLDRIPASARGAGYYLARAEMLDAAGQAPQAAATLEQALRTPPVETDVYLRAGAFLLRKQRVEEALQLSDRAMQALPQDRRILLLRAVVLEQAVRTAEARHLLEQIENRWPEWAPAWAAAGIILGIHGHSPDARAALRTAVTLGAAPEVKRYLDALSTSANAAPPDLARLLLSGPPAN